MSVCECHFVNVTLSTKKNNKMKKKFSAFVISLENY